MNSLRKWFNNPLAHRASQRPPSRKRQPSIESLESRLVLYSATGNAWMNPAIITISFVPDGTNLGIATSNLQSTFNGKASLNGRWETAILEGAQLWAQKTNINFVVVPDDGARHGQWGQPRG